MRVLETLTCLILVSHSSSGPELLALATVLGVDKLVSALKALASIELMYSGLPLALFRRWSSSLRVLVISLADRLLVASFELRVNELDVGDT